MSYNTLLDTWFSVPLLSYGIPAALFVAVLLFRDRLYAKKPFAFLRGAAFMAIPVFLIFLKALINPVCFGFGHPDGITGVHVLNGNVYVVDYVLTMNTRTVAGETYDRVHILDEATGEKKIRFRVGFDGRVIGLHGDSLAISRYSEVGYYSIRDGHSFATYNELTLPGFYPELSAGVDNFSWADGRNVMRISSRDAKTWLLFTQTRQIIPSKENGVIYDDAPTNKLYIHQHNIRRDSEHGGRDVIKLFYTSENQHKMFATNDDDSLLNKDLFFIDATPIAINRRDSSFVVLSYETTDDQKFILTCISFDGQHQLWQTKQTDLNPTYLFKAPHEVATGADEENEKLFVAIYKEIISLNMKDGKVLWRKAL